MVGSATELAEGLAARVASESRPQSPQLHLVPTGLGSTLAFVPNGSRIHALSGQMAEQFAVLLKEGDRVAIERAMIEYGLHAPPTIDDEPLHNPTLHAISLAVAQKCNMGCSYCYADQGDFGGPAQNMQLETAKRSIDLLLGGLEAGARAQVTFLGGEPLLNRNTLRAATEYARKRAAERGVQVGYSITTNGTLVRPDDADFFEEHGFAVTISLDGLRDVHDAQRPMKGGQGSYDRIMERIAPLLARQRRMQVSARVTVMPGNSGLVEALEEFVGMGFHSVGFSPLLRSSSGEGEMGPEDLRTLLGAMIACGLTFERHVLAGRRFPFLNMINALKEVGKGTQRPYPCGAGAGYMGVSADGELSACHRFVNEPAGRMGDLLMGVDADLQSEWLSSRHVHQQSPCNGCWARYLCGGGCHHEVLERGRSACDYIRGWLHYVLQAHERLSRLAPGWNQ